MDRWPVHEVLRKGINKGIIEVLFGRGLRVTVSERLSEAGMVPSFCGDETKSNNTWMALSRKGKERRGKARSGSTREFVQYWPPCLEKATRLL